MEKLPHFEAELEIRSFIGEDIPQAMKLLLQSQSKFYVHSVRDQQIWKMQQETAVAGEYCFEAYAVEDDGKMVAYFRISRKPEEKELILREVADTDYSASMAILSFLKKMGEKSGLDTLVARTSYCDPLTRILVAFGAKQSIPPYAWQIRATDYISLLQKMKPLFESRIATSEYSCMTEKLNLSFRRYMVQMTIENGAIASIQQLKTTEQRIMSLNPPASTQLLFGYRSREELEACYPDFNVRPEYKRLVDVLFPKLPSYIHAVY